MSVSLPLALLAGAVLTSAPVGLHALHVALLAVGLSVALAASESRQRRRRAATQRGFAMAADIAAQLLSPEGVPLRIRALLQELDTRTWLDTTVKKAWGRYHPRLSAWLANWLEVNVSDMIVDTLPGFVKGVSWSKVDLGRTPPTIIRVVPVRVSDPSILMLDLDIDLTSQLQVWCSTVDVRYGMVVWFAMV